MNDRHRTIARYQKKHRKKKKSVADVLAAINFSELGKSIATAIEAISSAIGSIAVAAVKAADEFANAIKTMPEEEYQDKLMELGPLTPEQLALLKKIRGDVNNERPNSESESMGE